jgi:hydrogenase maturation protease
VRVRAGPAARIVVIGLGNPLCGDDAAGIAVVRRLRRRSGVRLVEQAGEATALVAALRGASAALVVDAATGGPPGDVRRLDAAAGPLPAGLFELSTHGFGVAAGIELARALGALPATCLVYALAGARFAPGAAMSAEVATALPAVAAQVEADIAALRRGLRATLGCGESSGGTKAGAGETIVAGFGDR